jgi:nucleoside-diphosphate-sugar epimerase
MGPLFARGMARPMLVPVFPELEGLRFQAVHTEDVADAYLRAVTSDERGAFNIAAGPVLDARLLAELFDARPVRVPRRVARKAVSLLWRIHLQPTSPGWLDLALGVPLLDVTRARTLLGWAPRCSADEALRELIAGIRDGDGERTPPLSPRTSGPLRIRELLTGVGRQGGA